MEHITEEEIKRNGFKLVKKYDHDQYNTNRFKNGNLEVEFTYEVEDLQDVSLTIEEINAIPITVNELLVLNLILNKPIGFSEAAVVSSLTSKEAIDYEIKAKRKDKEKNLKEWTGVIWFVIVTSLLFMLAVKGCS